MLFFLYIKYSITIEKNKLYDKENDIHTSCDVIVFIYESDFELYWSTPSNIMYS